eukprot:TRINITY_DN23522_c0_g1_i1.p1 TRINITY_DN23522_c0_g1~~TRINITY_DN23522_c0_g1_i1.p1  ORF type:complete len:148 (+),score=29.40 TRINITY_DN23522_c0_g1_i1:128-571(+)
MIRRPPRSTQGVSSAASDVYKRQYKRRVHGQEKKLYGIKILYKFDPINKTEKEEFYEAKHVCSGKGTYVVDKFNINPDERINGISGTHHNIIDSIRIMTSTKNGVLEVGQKGEYYFEFMIPPTSKVIAFAGAFHGSVHNFKIYYIQS